jgi:hypothetical protein
MIYSALALTRTSDHRYYIYCYYKYCGKYSVMKAAQKTAAPPPANAEDGYRVNLDGIMTLADDRNMTPLAARRLPPCVSRSWNHILT